MPAYFICSAERQNEITRAVLALDPRLSAMDVQDRLLADWPNAADHQEWIDTAPVSEIAEWILSMNE